jgi:hypothetical protein
MSCSDIWILIISFFIGIAASIIASIIIIYYQKQNQLKRNINNFKKLEGKYQHFDTHRNLIERNYSEFTFDPPNKILIKTFSKKGHNWEGKVMMNEFNPSYGEGYYEYLYPDQVVWGIISITISKHGKELYVEAIDKSQKDPLKIGYLMIKI